MAENHLSSAKGSYSIIRSEKNSICSCIKSYKISSTLTSEFYIPFLLTLRIADFLFTLMFANYITIHEMAQKYLMVLAEFAEMKICRLSKISVVGTLTLRRNTKKAV